MKASDGNEKKSHPTQLKHGEEEYDNYIVVTIEDGSLEGAGISAGERVVVEMRDDIAASAIQYQGTLLCFVNRHDELMIGRNLPPYIELPFRDRTYRIKIADRRVVGVLVRK